MKETITLDYLISISSGTTLVFDNKVYSMTLVKEALLRGLQIHNMNIEYFQGRGGGRIAHEYWGFTPGIPDPIWESDPQWSGAGLGCGAGFYYNKGFGFGSGEQKFLDKISVCVLPHMK